MECCQWTLPILILVYVSVVQGNASALSCFKNLNSWGCLSGSVVG